MLQMRPSCERCDTDLPPDQAGAFICPFECTYCEACVAGRLGGTCPNCRGALVGRPVRATPLLAIAPASTERVVKAGGYP
jgi:hypothetical protein